MIVSESSKSKNLLLILLVILFTGIVIWQWAISDPFSIIEKEDGLLAEIKEETDDSFKDIQNSIDEGKEEIKNLDENLAKQAKQEQLIEEAKKYLGNKVDISDWENYINDDYGFELKYPSDWVIGNNYEDEDKISILRLSKSFFQNFGDKEFRVAGSFNISTYKDSTDKTLDELLNDYSDNEYYEIIENKKITINNQEAIYAVISDNVSGFQVRILKNNYNKVFLLYSRHNIGNELVDEIEEYNKQLGEIINSFKFVD